MNDYASLEASKRLVDAGIVLETEFSYYQEKPSSNPNIHSFGFLQEEMEFKRLFSGGETLSGNKNLYNQVIPAPSMAEVWRELPSDCIVQTGIQTYATAGFGMKDKDFYSINPTDALIDLLIWVRKEKP